MALRPNLRHRTAALVTAAAIAVPITAGCGAIDKAMDCAQTAVAISDSVQDLQQAVDGATDNPTQAQNALDAIDKNLQEISDKTDNADVSKAVDDLTTGVKNVREAIEQGKNPDITPVTDAASELTKVCSPG
jgi:peptidoglycan hydrolase CwlO-like protein